jgi:hypothetical protein
MLLPRPVLVLIIGLCIAALARAQQDNDPPPEVTAMIEARNLAMAVIIYTDANGTLPENIQKLADGKYLPDTGAPDEDGTQWLRDGVPYGYLGVDGVSASEVPDWGDIAIAHSSLEHAFAGQPHPKSPEGLWVAVAFLDGHAELVSPAEARWLIEDAKDTFAALRDGGPMPIYRQLEQDAGLLAQAMIAHAAERDGLAPADWAATFEYLPDNPRKAGEADKDKLRVYLSPKGRGNTAIPDFADTPEGGAQRDDWINARSMWRSDALGANLWRAPNPMLTLMLHARPDAWAEAPDRHQRKHVRRLAFATADGRGDSAEPDRLEARVQEARDLYDAIRTGGPLPPLDDAMHDLRALSDAIAAYARANEGVLPPDRGEVMPYVEGLWGIHDREPARIFLIRADETPENVGEIPDAAWIRTHCSYVYLGNANTRLRDLRGTNATMLIHAPIDRPFEFVVLGDVYERVPTIGPPLGSLSGPGDHFARSPFAFPPEVVAEQAEASSQAILEAGHG